MHIWPITHPTHSAGVNSHLGNEPKLDVQILPKSSSLCLFTFTLLGCCLSHKLVDLGIFQQPEFRSLWRHLDNSEFKLLSVWRSSVHCLYQNLGNYSGWKAYAIGLNNNT